MTDDSEQAGLPEPVYQELREALSADYALEGEVGRGASGVVFRAIDLKLKRAVAIKVLRPEVVSGAGSRRFEREILVAASLSHPHIVAIHSSGRAAGLQYYVMPLHEGESLRERLLRERQLPLDEALRITREIASALQYAHDRNFVHRDVKPENILLGSGEAVLGDFGLARVLHDDGTLLTATGIAVGTAAYMSPEQASGDAVDARTDQYSLACVLYETLAGVPPFHAATARGMLARHRLDPAPQVRHLRPTIPQGVEDALLKAMAKLPADRYPTVAEWTRALEGALTSDTLAAVRRPTHGTTPVKLLRIASAIVVAATLVVVGVFAWWQWRRNVVTLDPNRLVVAPFDVIDPADSVWRVGLVYVLSRNLDGIGPLRSVPPRVVARDFLAQPDGLSPAELSRRTRAGLVVSGQLVRNSSDELMLRVSLTDATTDRSLADVDITGRSSQPLELADSATILMLRGLSQTRRIVYRGGGGFLTRSLTALKAFLRGEELYQANDFTASIRYYEAAVREDSTFAVALRRLAAARRANNGEGDALARESAQRAAALNHGLGRRDSLLIVADSLGAARPRNSAFYDAGDRGLLRRRFQVLDLLAREYPSDPDARVALAEAWYHEGDRVGLSADDARAAFDNAISSDPSFGPAYYHAIELTLDQRGADSARNLTLRYLKVLPADRRFQIVRDLLAGGAAERRRVDPELRELAPDSLLDAADVLRGATGQVMSSEPVYRALLARNDVIGASVESDVYQLFARQLLRNGRPASAAEMVRRGNGQPGLLVSFGLATSGAIPPNEADSIFRDAARSPARVGVLLSLGWFGESRNVEALRAIQQRTSNGGPSDSSSEFRRYVAGAAAAYLALAAGHESRALSAFLSLPDSFCSALCQPQRVQTARLLLANGQIRDAAPYLDRFPIDTDSRFYEAPWRLVRGDVAYALGDLKRAKHEYERIVAAFNPDNNWARRLRDSAQAGLAKVNGTPAPHGS